MTITLELPSELEKALQQKASTQGVSVPDLLLRLARTEAQESLYSQAEIDGFLDEDRLPPEISDKVQRLLGR